MSKKRRKKRRFSRQQCIYCTRYLTPVEEHSGELACSRCREWEDERDKMNMSNIEYAKHIRGERHAGL